MDFLLCYWLNVVLSESEAFDILASGGTIKPEDTCDSKSSESESVHSSDECEEITKPVLSLSLKESMLMHNLNYHECLGSASIWFKEIEFMTSEEPDFRQGTSLTSESR